MTNNIPPHLLSAKEYAEKVGVTDRSVKRWIAEGELDGTLLGTKWYVPFDAVRRVPEESSEMVVARRAAPTAITLVSSLEGQPAFLSLEVAAQLLGVTEFTIRQHQEFFGVMPFGPKGSLVVPQSTVRNVAGL